MADMFSTHSSALDSPARAGFAITPDDNDLAQTTRALYTGKGGTLVCILADDAAEVTFSSVPAGQILPLRIRRVKATGTTASMIWLGWCKHHVSRTRRGITRPGGDTPSLALNFLQNTLDSRLTFSRASAATEIVNG